MSLNREILLCFSEEDNQPIEGGLKGWVSNFHKFLSTLLAQISREQVAIRTVSGDDLKNVNFEAAGVIITIPSQNLMAHDHFLNGLNDFAKKAKANDTLRMNGISKIFKVNKKPFDIDSLLPEIADLIPYDFYQIDPLTGEAQEFKRFFGNEAERSYWMKLVDMAYDINHLIIAEIKEDKKVEEHEIARDKTIYLASTGVDMVIQRDIIKRELIRHGYHVYPQHSLPKEIKALEEMIKNDLQLCRLSIHLVGEDYGYRPKGSELSVVDIQNRLASNHTYEMIDYNNKADIKLPFSRLIWVSPELKNVTERQKIFIEDLKSDAASLEEAEVLQITLPELKSIIREELVTGGRFNTKREIKGYNIPEEDGSRVIYLMADKSDKKDSISLKEYLEKSGYKVIMPSFEGDLVDIRYIHQENLRRCDATIIYFGKSTESWIKTKLQDLLKAPGFGREKKLLAKAVYFQGQKDVDLKHYEKNNALVLGNNGGFKPEHLQPFLTKLES
ncbi:MAG: putative DNA-binding transcriptional regulator [Cyclobacteriaceae bacterium]|jgi:predicted DNA-binding transcriptional regulator